MSRPARSKHDRSPASACWAAKVTRRFANRSRKFSVSPCQNLFGMQANGPVEFGALQPILDSPGDSWRRKTVLEEGKETHHSSLPIEIGNCRNGRATEALSRSVYPVATPGHDALHSASQAACSLGLAQNSRQLEPWDSHPAIAKPSPILHPLSSPPLSPSPFSQHLVHPTCSGLSKFGVAEGSEAIDS